MLAYGSRVKGLAHDNSDLDLVIINLNDENKNITGLHKFKDALSESNLPILVDALDWSKIPQSFQQEILLNHIVIWPADRLGTYRIL